MNLLPNCCCLIMNENNIILSKYYCNKVDLQINAPIMQGLFYLLIHVLLPMSVCLA